MKILVRGGSVPAGHGCNESYCEILSRGLGKEITLVNRSGYRETSFEAVETFYRDIDPHRPEILLIHFGIDDAYHPVYRSEFKENLVQLVRLASKRFSPEIILLTSHPFENFYHMEEVYIYYRTIREVAVDLECALLPVHSIWNGILMENGLNHKDFIQEDSRYPNNRGQEMYAKIIGRFLNKVITRGNKCQ